MGGRSVVISASAAGELVFTDLLLRRDVTKTSVHCVVSSMKLLFNSRLSTTHLLVRYCWIIIMPDMNSLYFLKCYRIVLIFRLQLVVVFFFGRVFFAAS